MRIFWKIGVKRHFPRLKMYTCFVEIVEGLREYGID